MSDSRDPLAPMDRVADHLFGPVAQQPPTELVSDNPTIREERGPSHGNGPGRLDEFIARDCRVHFEAMGDAQFWMQVDLPDGRSWHINFGAVNPNAKGYAHAERIDGGAA